MREREREGERERERERERVNRCKSSIMVAFIWPTFIKKTINSSPLSNGGKALKHPTKSVLRLCHSKRASKYPVTYHKSHFFKKKVEDTTKAKQRCDEKHPVQAPIKPNSNIARHCYKKKKKKINKQTQTINDSTRNFRAHRNESMPSDETETTTLRLLHQRQIKYMHE